MGPGQIHRFTCGNRGLRNINLTRSKVDEPHYGADESRDLSGEAPKFVTYSIVFTKRDFEATLQHEREEVVDYDTDGGSFGALKVSEFLHSLNDRLSVPHEWRDGAGGRPGPDEEYGYLPSIEEDGVGTYSNIPDEDRKYIRFLYAVTCRMQKPDHEDRHHSQD